MADKFAVIGLGLFGSAIARRLSERGAEVIAIDNDEEKIEGIKDDVAYAVTLDASDKRALESQNIASMDAVVVAIGKNFQDLLLTVFQLQEIGVKRIIARAQGVIQKRILMKMGVTELLSPEDEVSNNVAEQLTNPGVLMCVELPDDFEIVEVQAPKSILNRALQDINFTERYRLNLVTLLRKVDGKHHVLAVTEQNTKLQDEDILVLFGRTKDINRFIEINQ